MKPLARPLKAGDALRVVWRPEQQADVDHSSQGCAQAGSADSSRRSHRERRAPTPWWQQGLSVDKVVYDCKVTHVISSSNERTVVDAQLSKADGSLFAELQLTLTASALCSDADINASLPHLTWAFKAQGSSPPAPPALSSRQSPAAGDQARHDSPPIKRSKPTASVSDPLCSVCAKQVAYDMPLKRLVGALIGPSKVDLGDLFSMPGGRVKANSALKKLVQCDDCSQKGELKLVVCTSGGAGNRLTCDWCRCRMTTNTTDAASMWCGSKHNNCRQLVPENETNRQGNSTFLTKGLAPVKETAPYDEVKLIDVDLSSYNNADYVVVAKSSLGRALVLIEIDNNQHAGGGQYSPELEAQKNTNNFACGKAFDRVLFLIIKGSALAREHLALASRHPQPARH